jgi:hypothetical protein
MNKKFVKLSLNVEELEYVRDLFSVMFDDGSTLSERLAGLLDKKDLEQSLWHKIYKECKANNLLVDKEAPNFLISTSDITLGVFKAKFLSEAEEEKKDEKSKSRSNDISSAQNKNKDNTMSNRRRSDKKKPKG